MSAFALPTTERTPLIALLVSYGTVQSGTLLFMMALPWFVLETTGSAARTGLATAVHGIPMVIVGIFGGVIVDRLGFRRTVIISDLMSAIAFGMIPVLHLLTGISFWQLLVLVFIGAIFDTPSFTARLGLMPEIARRAGIRLERANSVGQTLSQGSILLAPALGGILIGMIGAAPVIFFTTGLMLISTLAVLLFVPSAASTAQTSVDEEQRGRYLTELRHGLSFLLNVRVILALMVGVALLQVLRGSLTVILPVYVQQFLTSAADFGFMFAALGGGGLISAILFGVWGHRWPRRPIILVGVTSQMMTFVLLALTPPFWVILTGLVTIGFFSGPMIPLIFTVLQERTPAQLRGRVFGLYDASIFAAMIPGRLLTGYLIEWTSIVQTVMVIGAAYFVALIGLFLNPHLHHLQRNDPAESTEDVSWTDSDQEQSPSGVGDR